MDSYSSALPFLHLVGFLKRAPRVGWQRMIEHPESVADHSYRLALLVSIAPANLDRNRCIWLALCHDIAESVVNDIPTYANIPKKDKHRLEEMGIRYIQNLIERYSPSTAQDIADAWKEYEEGETPEAKFVKEMDKVECLIQATEYEQQTFGEKNFEEFQTTYLPKIQSHMGKQMVRLLQQEKAIHSLKRGNPTRVIFVVGGRERDKRVLCSSLSEVFGFQCLALDEVLREKAEDPTCEEGKIISYCLEQILQVPINIGIKYLDEKIERSRWALVYGIPENVQYLTRFQEQQKTSYVLHLSCSSETPLDQESERGNVLSIQDYGSTVLQTALAGTDYYKDVDGDGSEDEVLERSKAAIEEILRHEQSTEILRSDEEGLT